MTRLLWSTIATAVAALVISATALAQFAPRMVIDENNYGPSAGSGTTEIEVIAKKEENSIAKISIYTPPGYTATLGQAAGTELGTASAKVQAKEIGENAVLDITGKVVVGDTTNATLQAQAAGCTGTTVHDAYWLLALTAAGTPLNIPLFVDRTVGPEALFSSYKIQVCFTSPDIPSSKGGAPFGAKILDAVLDLNGIYTNPSARGQYAWRGVFTPYTAGTGTANPAGTVESRGIVSIPSILTLTARYTATTNTFSLQGTLSEGTGRVSGAAILILRGTAVKSLKPGGTARTNAKGVFRKSGKLKPRKATFFVAARPATAVENGGGCGAPNVFPFPCVTATVNDVFSALRKVTPKKR